MAFGQLVGALASTVAPALVKGFGQKMGLSGEMAGSMGQAIPAMTKIAGIPMPGTGHQLGQDTADFLKSAYPGTNPWEQLGSGGQQGAVEVADRNIKGQKEMQDKELETRETIARIQADATTQSAAIAHGPDAVTSISGYRSGDTIKPYATPSQRVPAEITKLTEDARRIKGEADLVQAKAKFAELFAKYGLSREAAPNLWAALRNLGMETIDQTPRTTNKQSFTNMGNPQLRQESWDQLKKEIRKFFNGPWLPNPNNHKVPKKTSAPGSVHYKSQ